MSTSDQRTMWNVLLVPVLLMASLIVSPFVAADDTEIVDKSPSLSADELKARGFQPLFTGDSLDLWNLQPGHRGHWTVEDGIINYDGKAEQKKFHDRNLWTKKSYGDSVLRVDWRFPIKPKLKQHPIVLWNGDFLLDKKGKRITRPALDAGDSGILFRGILKCQANIWCQEMGSGEINGYRTDKKLPVLVRRSCIPFINADRPMGEWNTFEITLKESRMTVELNGVVVLKSEPLPDLPDSGPIGLQHHGDHVQFKNIWIKELNE